MGYNVSVRTNTRPTEGSNEMNQQRKIIRGLMDNMIQGLTITVQSGDSGKVWNITKQGVNNWHCSCPDHKFRKRVCKHMKALFVGTLNDARFAKMPHKVIGVAVDANTAHKVKRSARRRISG